MSCVALLGWSSKDAPQLTLRLCQFAGSQSPFWQHVYCPFAVSQRVTYLFVVSSLPHLVARAAAAHRVISGALRSYWIVTHSRTDVGRARRKRTLNQAPGLGGGITPQLSREGAT